MRQDRRWRGRIAVEQHRKVGGVVLHRAHRLTQVQRQTILKELLALCVTAPRSERCGLVPRHHVEVHALVDHRRAAHVLPQIERQVVARRVDEARLIAGAAVRLIREAVRRSKRARIYVVVVHFDEFNPTKLGSKFNCICEQLTPLLSF